MAQTRYEVTDIGTLPGLSASYVCNVALNNRGQIAAYANNAENPLAFAGDVPFLWKGPGQIQRLPTLPGATDTLTIGMNDAGQISGMSGAVVWNDAHAVLWDQGRVFDLGTLPGDAGSDAGLISGSGLVVGDSYNADYSLYRGVYWDRSHRIHLLPGLPGATLTQAYGVNNQGHAVGWSGTWESGWSGVLWKDGRVINLGSLGGAYCWPVYISDRDEVCGESITSDGGDHAFLWRNGQMIDLGNFGNDVCGFAACVGNRGEVVGFSGAGIDDVHTAHALLWQDGKMINLQDRLRPGSGWVLQQAMAINDRGQIAGTGWHNGQLRGFLMTPKD